jgi:hypothetical protein
MMKFIVLRHSTFNIRYSAVLWFLAAVFCHLTSVSRPLAAYSAAMLNASAGGAADIRIAF